MAENHEHQDYKKMLEDDLKAHEGEVFPNLLQQEDPELWHRQPPHKLRGDMKYAHMLSRRADEMHCNCWNTRCPIHDNCKACLVFHIALKQIPTCMRATVIDLLKEGVLAHEMYLTDEPSEPMV